MGSETQAPSDSITDNRTSGDIKDVSRLWTVYHPRVIYKRFVVVVYLLDCLFVCLLVYSPTDTVKGTVCVSRFGSVVRLSARRTSPVIRRRIRGTS